MFLFVFVAVKTFKHILYHLKLYQNTWWTFYTPVQLYCVNQTITTQQARTQATTISFHFLTFFLESTIFYNCPTFFLESTISYHFPTFFLESTLPLVVFHLLHRSPGLPTVRSHLTYSVVTIFENWAETSLGVLHKMWMSENWKCFWWMWGWMEIQGGFFNWPP